MTKCPKHCRKKKKATGHGKKYCAKQAAKVAKGHKKTMLASAHCQKKGPRH